MSMMIINTEDQDSTVGETELSSNTTEAQPSRSISDINSILDFAKLGPSDFRRQVQCLYFSQQLDNDGVKLMELEGPIQDALQAGEIVEIRGDANDGAVVVTDSATFEVKDAETSNSMLMLPHLKYGPDISNTGDQEIVTQQVTSIAHNYFELRRIKPRLQKLRSLLSENPYRGRECEGDEQDTGKKYTFSELQERVQASDAELREGLLNMKACEIQGRWRLLDFEYASVVLQHTLQVADEGEGIHSDLSLSQCVSVLADLFPFEVIHHTVRSHSKPRPDKMDTDEEIYHLCEDKLCRHFAEMCLKNSGKFNLDDFLTAWKGSVPDGINTNLSQLEGMALIDREARPPVIWYYSVDLLPEDISERFEVLFYERKKWSLEEITPYIKGLTNEKMNVNALLTKFARASLSNGIKMFSSRKTT